MQTTAESHNRSFRLDIQGLRAVAVLAVVLYHAGVPGLAGGFVGVDVFFVVSGFLITSHLMREIVSTGRVKLATFYARRARRLLPASMLVIVLSVLAALFVYDSLGQQDVATDAAAAAAYVPNVLFAIQGTDYLAGTEPSLFQHYWSLGVEEQFYLVWPLLLLAVVKLFKQDSSRLLALLALSGASFAASLWLTAYQQPLAFFLLPTRAWELGAGALVALALAGGSHRWVRAVAPAATWLGLSGNVLAVLVVDTSWPFPGVIALLPVTATAMVIYFGELAGSRGAARLLDLWPFQYFGKVSYSLYLVHWPVLVIGAKLLGEPLGIGTGLALVALSIALADVLFRWVEPVAQRSGWLRKVRPGRQLGLVLVASVVIVALSVGVGRMAQRDLAADGIAPAPSFDGPVVGTAFVPSNLQPSLQEATEDNPMIYADGCHRNMTSAEVDGCVYGDGDSEIALFGDSHAAQWAPALLELADATGRSLKSYTKSACPSLEGVVVQNGSAYASCAQWRDNVVDDLRERSPEVIFVSNYYRNYFEDGTLVAVPEEAVTGMLLELREIAPVVLLADTPLFPQEPANCLADNLEDALACSVPATDALYPQWTAVVQAAAEESGAQHVDLSDVMCGETCPAIHGNVLAFRDTHHMTATFSALLGPVLQERLDW